MLQTNIILLSIFIVTNNAVDLENFDIDGKINPEKLSVNIVTEKKDTHWPMGIVLYYFDYNSYDNLIESRVHLAMSSLESASCVRFEPMTAIPDENSFWINITNPEHTRECVHEPHITKYGEIRIVLGLDCLSRQDILRALLHGLGFKDEVTHPQRDQYIRILWENIQPEYRHLFRIQYDDSTSKNLVEYDPMSILHFHDRAFSRNGHATIAPLIPGLQINPSSDLSQLDKMKLRLLFGHECNKRNVGNLLDTCKQVLHEENKLKLGEKPVADDEMNNNGEQIKKDNLKGVENVVMSNEHDDSPENVENNKHSLNEDST